MKKNNIHVCGTVSNANDVKYFTRLSIPELNIEFWMEEEKHEDTDGYAIGTSVFVYGKRCVSTCIYSDGDVRAYDANVSNYVEMLIRRLYRAVQNCDVRPRHLLDIASAMSQGPCESTVSRDIRRGYCRDRNTGCIRKITRRERDLR